MKRRAIFAILFGHVVGALLAAPAGSEKGWGAASGAPTQKAAPQRVRLTPELQAGQTLRYQLDFRTTTDIRSEGLAENPQGGGALELRFSSTVKLEVLAAAPARIRVTYEKSAATARGGAFDPVLAAIQEQYTRLEGRSVVLTLDAAGKVTSTEGLEEIISDPKAAAGALQSLSQMLTSAAPPQGMAVGEKWSDEQPLPGAPLAAMVVRGESTYLRNEPCHTQQPGAAPAAGGVEEICAVILTRTQTLQRGAPRDPTPAEYRERGLRTSGRWTGASQSLTLISLRTGWVVSATQSGGEEMDYTVSTANSSGRVHNFGKVQTQSNILLLKEEVGSKK